MTWILLGVWAVLVGFGILSLFDPAWLERLGQRGRSAEASTGRNLGDLAYRRGDYNRAIGEYLEALKIDPEAADIHHNLGVVYLEQRQVAAAREALLKAEALATAPRLRSFVALHLGDVARLEGRRDEALQHYAAALGPAMRPDLVYRNMGAVYLETKNYELAREAFEKTLEAQLDPLLPYREMLNRAQDAATLDADVETWLDSWRAREFDEADWARLDRETLQLMHESDPEIAKTHNHLGLIYFNLGQREKAVQHFEASLAIWPGNLDAVRNLRILKR
jgi:tetratricopeptide (TPR) repeat protein